jgi:GAF domain-containing protein
LAAARPETEPDSDLGPEVEPSPAASRAAAERRPILVNDLVAGASGICSELAVPVFVSSELWGAITLQSSTVDAFESDDAELLQRVADHVGSALRTADCTATSRNLPRHRGRPRRRAGGQGPLHRRPRPLDRRARRPGRARARAGTGRSARPALWRALP